MLNHRETGTVRWFDEARGVGLIGRADREDVLVHFSAIRRQYFRTLDEGQHVEFHVLPSQRGPLAGDVVVLSDGGRLESGCPRPARRQLDEHDLQAMLEEHHRFIVSQEREGHQLDLWGADLRGAHLRNADLRRAVLEGADLEDADLAGADLSQSFVFQASFRGTDLTDADLSRTLACETDFSEARLAGSTMRGSNLYGAGFVAADLSRTDFNDAELTCADFTGATGLSFYRIAKARALHRATFAPRLAQRLQSEHPALFLKVEKEDAATPTGQVARERRD